MDRRERKSLKSATRDHQLDRVATTEVSSPPTLGIFDKYSSQTNNPAFGFNAYHVMSMSVLRTGNRMLISRHPASISLPLVENLISAHGNFLQAVSGRVPCRSSGYHAHFAVHKSSRCSMHMAKDYISQLII